MLESQLCEYFFTERGNCTFHCMASKFLPDTSHFFFYYCREGNNKDQIHLFFNKFLIKLALSFWLWLVKSGKTYLSFSFLVWQDEIWESEAEFNIGLLSSFCLSLNTNKRVSLQSLYENFISPSKWTDLVILHLHIGTLQLQWV
jgi:hypothetical protein